MEVAIDMPIVRTRSRPMLSNAHAKWDTQIREPARKWNAPVEDSLLLKIAFVLSVVDLDRQLRSEEWSLSFKRPLLA